MTTTYRIVTYQDGGTWCAELARQTEDGKRPIGSLGYEHGGRWWAVVDHFWSRSRARAVRKAQRDMDRRVAKAAAYEAHRQGVAAARCEDGWAIANGFARIPQEDQ